MWDLESLENDVGKHLTADQIIKIFHQNRLGKGQFGAKAVGSDFHIQHAVPDEQVGGILRDERAYYLFPTLDQVDLVEIAWPSTLLIKGFDQLAYCTLIGIVTHH